MSQRKQFLPEQTSFSDPAFETITVFHTLGMLLFHNRTIAG